ncbi:EmbC-like arabinotransferase in arabinogalactan biosynthesis [Geodermatophilus normandii]|uniref:EmbC-like arabinotransferase in arabinogalactan biosynthesis n=1 Tax=Geodermatophilus normandii TaxID=1137989 RepID=A0A317QMQ6_9ACTN|nr:arabinosyltransferase domain-containing protein [Geodermatophilus normandii]PWW22920.1 EmbC-like arabinotransferase in arabinogalactan biosynthesis [Geodermatophilus normandii]
MGAPSVIERQRLDPGDERPERAGGRRGRIGTELAILVTALIALFCAAALPLAPVSMSMPTVSWPQDPTQPVSTSLQLTAEQPLAVDVRFSCAALDSVAGGDGRLLSTVLPNRPTEDNGLQVRVEDGSVLVRSNGTEIYRGPLSSGACEYALTMDGDSTRLSLDGQEVAQLGRALPDVDVLATSFTGLPGGSADDLSVSIRVDDQFSTSPTAVKWVLTAILLVSAIACLVLLTRWDRRRRALRPGAVRPDTGRLPWYRHLSIVDAGVVALLLVWLFIAPMTDDDGYYAAMARASMDNGYVGNYYQLYNQGYTPFTWFYQLLGYWDQLGHAPVLLRIPSLVAGLLTWAVARALLNSIGLPRLRSRMQRFTATAVAALVFAMAWLPYCLGVRPESIVALLAVLVFGAVVVARRRDSLAWFAVALLIAGIAVTCHPTGLVALTPWLLSIPQIWRLVRSSSLWRTLARAAGVIAPAALAAIPGFLDGSLNDFKRSGEIFDVNPNAEWYDEWLRYQFLLSDGPMGAYAKRITVLLSIVCLLWFVVLQLSSGGRVKRAWPPLVALAGWSYGLSLLMFWIAPSKWTHHFGAVSGLSTVFVTAVLVHGVRVAVAAQRGRRTIAPGVVLAAVSLVLAFALAMHGPNTWAYSWLMGLPHTVVSPFIGGVSLDSPVVWLVVLLLTAAVVTLTTRRDRRSWGRIAGRTFPAVTVVFLVAGFAYLVGGFGLATVRTWDGYSPWADTVQDPLARNCGAQHAFSAPAMDTATELPVASSEGATATGFGADGYHPTSPPPDAATGAPTVWGSYPELGGEANQGEMTSDWFTVPPAEDGEEMLVLVSGRLGFDNELAVEWGTRSGSTISPVAEQSVDDGIDSTYWRQIRLVPPAGERPDVVRLLAADGGSAPGGWLAVSAPLQARVESLERTIPADATLAVAWQFSFLFPCADLPETVFGITEQSDYVFASGTPGLSGLGDNIFTRGRGGLMYPTIRSSSLTKLDAVAPTHPEPTSFQAYSVQNPYVDVAYTLDPERVTRWGWEKP